MPTGAVALSTMSDSDGNLVSLFLSQSMGQPQSPPPPPKISRHCNCGKYARKKKHCKLGLQILFFYRKSVLNTQSRTYTHDVSSIESNEGYFWINNIRLLCPYFWKRMKPLHLNSSSLSLHPYSSNTLAYNTHSISWG